MPPVSWLTRWLKLPAADDPEDEWEPDYPEDPELVAEHAALMADLADAGQPVENMMELAPLDYRAQIPLLARWLEQAQQLEMKTAILSLLRSHASAPEVVEALLREYGRFELDWVYRWQIASVINDVNDPAIGERLLPLAIDPRQGRGAEMALIALGRMKVAGALGPLIDRLDDPDLVGHAADGLGRLGDPAALPALERARPARDWERTEVARAIRKLRRRA